MNDMKFVKCPRCGHEQPIEVLAVRYIFPTNQGTMIEDLDIPSWWFVEIYPDCGHCGTQLSKFWVEQLGERYEWKRE